jgi:MFS family permease
VSKSVIPKTVWALGIVSLLMDMSSEMIHSLLPLFMVTELSLSAVSIGLIEGAAESTALIVKVFSGVLSDYLGRRKQLAVLGYGLGAMSKFGFALASGGAWIMAARLSDRVGKGIRGAPRDALIADITAPEHRGAAFGLRQSLDTVGAFLGPLIAVGLMLLWANDFRAIFWVAVIPAWLAVLVLWLGVKEPHAKSDSKRARPISRKAMRQLSSHYWRVVLIGAFFTLARFSEAFLVLRAENIGIALAWVPLVMVVMSGVYSATAYPFGKWSDRLPPHYLLIAGLLVLMLADAVLAVASDWALMLLGVAIWGIHMGMTQGLLAKMVAETAPAALMGTAFGLFNLMSGLAMLVASGVAGYVWDSISPEATFYTGAGFCGLTVLLVMGLYRQPASALG